jgi:glutamyl-tRNA reductase
MLGDLARKRLLVVGAGRIGLQTLKAAERRGIADVAVANRTPERAAEVARRFGASAHALDELAGPLATADVVVTATAAESPVVSSEVVRVAMADRVDRPLVVVDLAVPSDVEREVGDVAGVRLFDVDDLRAGLDDAMAARIRGSRRSRRSSSRKSRPSHAVTASSRWSRSCPSFGGRRSRSASASSTAR